MRVGLRQDDRRASGYRIDRQEVEPLLIAAEALDIECAAVLRPVDAGEIDVGVGAHIDLDAATVRQAGDVEVDDGVRPPGARIALLDDDGAGRGDVGARHDVNRRLVDVSERDARLVGRPPVAGVAVKLLLRDELRRRPTTQLAAVGRQRALGAARRRHDIEVVVAHVGDEAALRRHLGVDLVRRRRGELPDLGRGALPQPDVALHGNEDEAALLVPVVVDDTRGLDALPLSPRLFRFGQLAALGRQRAAVDKEPRRAALGARRPQVGHPLVVGLRLQIGDKAAVRGQLDAAGARA